MEETKPSFKYISVALLLVALIWTIRWLLLPYPDLIDSTEGRYASVAKYMYDTGEMVTPVITRRGLSEPYLGKPPLYFWLGHVAYSLMGPTAEAARSPSFTSAVGTVVVTFTAIMCMFNLQIALASALILSSSAIFFFLSGTCMLDMTVTFAVTAACFGFYNSPRSIIWGYLSFLGLVVGFLTKGPIAIVLAAAVVVPWIFVQWYPQRVRPIQISAMPWRSGSVLFLLLTIPWYLLQEMRTGGFLYYFFVQENFLRYISSDYGDRYGTGHRQPRGASWVMLIGLAAPWSLLLVGSLLWKMKRSSFKSCITTLKSNPGLLFVTLMATTCPAFFTFARQLTATYILPALPGCASLTAVILLSAQEEFTRVQYSARRALNVVSLVLLAIACIASLVSIFFSNSWLTWFSLSVATIGIVALYLKLFWGAPHDAEGTMEKRITIGSIVSVFAFATFILSYSNYQSLTRSTAQLFELIRSHAQSEKSLQVGFPYEFPFSTAFYSYLGKPPRITPRLVTPDQINLTPCDFFAVNKERVNEFESLALSEIKVGNIGDWHLYRVAQ